MIYSKFFNTSVFTFLFCNLAYSQAVKTPAAAAITFDPDAPLYIEYLTQPAEKKEEVSVDIQDAKSSSRIRLSLQAKPNESGKYYGYIWLQLGKKITNEVQFFKAKKTSLHTWKTSQDGVQALFLFDNESDKKAFVEKTSSTNKPLVDRANLPTLINPTGVAPTNPAAKALENTLSAELSEAARYEKLIEAYEKLPANQKALNDKRAAQLAQTALKNYTARNFTAAETQFNESLRFNPTVGLNKYYLGLCLYQNKKYEKSLALLALAEGSDYNYAEYNYYKGLNNLKLKSYEKAIEGFENSRDEKDPDYSAPSAFFMGHIYFQQENYTEARKNFEITMDNKSTAKMDREAEMMLEKIDYIEGFKNQMNQRFTYNLFMGLAYDSNVLNISTENLSTNLAAYRVLYGAQGNYKLFFNYSHDMAIDASINDYYSLDSGFKSDATIQSADPLQMSVGLPYHKRLEISRRIFTWGIYPSYSSINMSLDGGSRKKIVDSGILGTDLVFAYSEKWFSRFYLEFAQDKSAIEASSAENDQSASKYSFSTTQTWSLDAAERKSVDFDLGYTLNAANGDNVDYGKITGGVGYSFMGVWKALNMVDLNYVDTNYNNSTSGRKDQVVSLMYGVSKDLTKKVNLNISGTYSISQSTVDTYDYNKFLIQAMATYSGAF